MLLLSQSFFCPCVVLLPSCSLAPFNHPLLLWESHLCSSTEGPESLLIIPQHGSHLHKHAAKNKPFPSPATLHTRSQKKKFPLIYKDASLSLASPKIIRFAFCSGIGPIFVDQFKTNKWLQWLCHVKQNSWNHTVLVLFIFFSSMDRGFDYLRQGVTPQTQSEILPLVQPEADATHLISSAVQLDRLNLTLILWQIGDKLEIHNVTHTLKQNGREGWTNSDLLVTPIMPHSQVFHQFDTWFKTRALLQYRW